MYKVYDQWPNIAREAYSSSQDVVDFDKIDHIVFAGMGGSGAIGDILSAILSKTNSFKILALNGPNSNAAELMGIKRFPTFVLFYPNGTYEIYNGERDITSILDYLNKKMPI